MKEIEQYRHFEISIPEVDGLETIEGAFTCDNNEVVVQGFDAGDGRSILRFMPTTTGLYHYKVTFGENLLEGSFSCVPCSDSNHGMVRTDEFGFKYSDDVKYLPFGTTCYAWIYQSAEVIEETLSTLSRSPFNKIRMLIFPKSMIYNEEDPPYFPYQKNAADEWDIDHPNPAFWSTLEKCILALDSLGIEADIILFHPYDRWGFSSLPEEDNLKHIRYCIQRLSAFKNVWWSLANEYDLMPEQSEKSFEAYARLIQACDPYQHLLSIHNCFKPYDKKPWMTHCSLQTSDTKSALAMRIKYQLPVIIDECGYEGNIPFDWGNLSAFEMVHRVWMGCLKGGFCSHGETLNEGNNQLWWSKGGHLNGKSAKRIAFLKHILETLPGEVKPFSWEIKVDPNGKEQEGADSPFAQAMMRLDEEERTHRILDMLPMVLHNEDCWLQYLGRSCQNSIQLEAPGEGLFQAELIDVWEMTRSCICEQFEAELNIDLPETEGTAILLQRVSAL